MFHVSDWCFKVSESCVRGSDIQYVDYGAAFSFSRAFMHDNAVHGPPQSWCGRSPWRLWELSQLNYSVGSCSYHFGLQLTELFLRIYWKSCKWVSVRTRLKSMNLDKRCRLPPLPTVLLSNVQSIRNKMDDLEAWTKVKREIKETCILAFTEMWLSDSDWDEDLFLSGFGSPLRLDRSPEITGKRRGGGVCFFFFY